MEAILENALFYIIAFLVIGTVLGFLKEQIEKSVIRKKSPHPISTPELVNEKVNVGKDKNIVRCMVDGRYDGDGTVGHYNNGTVYCLSKYGNFIVGYYREEKEGILTVRTNKDNEVIGFVRGDKIILTRKGQCDRFEKIGFPKYPAKMEWICAERFSNCICNIENTDCIALCDEDNWEAAAAFICMQYDGLNTSSTVFHQFWHSWL